MYIHKKYSLNNEIQDIKVYKTALKEITKLNLRRSSKLNILAILGALSCVDKSTLSDTTGIYICSEYGSIVSVKKVLEELSNDSIIMPFDFLNINTNNASFYVSQALESHGKNMVLTSDNLSFEKGLELALFDLEIDELQDVLIGKVDESLCSIKDYNKYISNLQNLPSNDYSGWLYINETKENALCKIESVESFSSITELNKKIKALNYDTISLNQFAKININTIHADTNKITYKETLNTMEYIIDFIESSFQRMILISMDTKEKGVVFYIKK